MVRRTVIYRYLYEYVHTCTCAYHAVSVDMLGNEPTRAAREIQLTVVRYLPGRLTLRMQ